MLKNKIINLMILIFKNKFLNKLYLNIFNYKKENKMN